MTPYVMPVRSLTQSLLHRPEPEQILHQVRLWAAQVAVEHPGLERVGLFGSYGRGDAGVGSDLDLLLIDTGSNGPQHHRLLAWPLAELPLSCDALVLTPSEHAELLASGSEPWPPPCNGTAAGCGTGSDQTLGESRQLVRL
jgi:hypothetical protein